MCGREGRESGGFGLKWEINQGMSGRQQRDEGSRGASVGGREGGEKQWNMYKGGLSVVCSEGQRFV